MGQMLTEAARLMGFKVIVLDPVPNSPAAQAGAEQIVKDYSKASIEELAKGVDYLTTEFEEGLDPDLLKHLTSSGTKVNPAPQTIELILDKLIQKDYLAKHGVAMGDYQAIKDLDEANALLEKYGGKMLIKTRKGGYDGYGNRVVSSREEVAKAMADFANKTVYGEAFIDFKKELAVMVARDTDGNIVTYPVVETIQKNNICHEVLAPADVNAEISKQAIAMAEKVAGLFKGAGVFGIEMFLTADGEILLNEIAPRVHNSGHYTIEACKTSQFEQHIRAITGLPLASSEMIVPAAVMINILGERNGAVDLQGLDEASSDPHTTVHIYGKSPTKIGRKMGHITSTGSTIREAREKSPAST